MVKTSLLALPLLAAINLTCNPQEPYDNTGDYADIVEADTEVRVSVVVPLDVEGLEGLILTLTPAPQCPGYWEDAKGEDITPWSEVLDLQSMIYPNGDPVADGPNEYDSALAEAGFIDVVPGCYNLVAVPELADGDDVPALSCVVPEITIELAAGDSVIFDASMTCGDLPRPELEVQATNTPPLIDELVVNSQATACDLVEVCATAHDQDFDMLEFEWIGADAFADDPTGSPWPTVTSHTVNEDRSVTQCVAVQAAVAGTHALALNVYDVTRPGPEARPVRVEDLRDEPSHASESAEIDATLGCANTARSAVILFTLDNGELGMPEDAARQLIDNAVQWTTDSAGREILVVLDDNHRGEDWRDGEFVHQQLELLGYGPDYIVEPVDGLDPTLVEGYDLVWFVNPGHEVDDLRTHAVLNAFRQEGGALVLQGDDIARFRGDPQFMRPLTYLSWEGNGTVACGAWIDNNEGEAYTVSFDADGAAEHPLTLDLAGKSFEYGNDIDLTRGVNAGEEVLAWATYETQSCVVRTPALVALDPDLLSPL